MQKRMERGDRAEGIPTQGVSEQCKTYCGFGLKLWFGYDSSTLMSSSSLSSKIALTQMPGRKLLLLLLLWYSEGPAWGTEIPLGLHWFLVKMIIKHSATASRTVKELRGPQWLKANPECCQGPSPEIFSHEWTHVVCWCTKWDASMLHPAGEKPGKLLEL